MLFGALFILSLCLFTFLYIFVLLGAAFWHVVLLPEGALAANFFFLIHLSCGLLLLLCHVVQSRARAFVELYFGLTQIIPALKNQVILEVRVTKLTLQDLTTILHLSYRLQS